MNILLSVVEALLLVTALSMDAFVSSFAYGTNKIKIPMRSIAIISVICTFILSLSLFLGSILSGFISEDTSGIICMIILVVLGFAKIFDSTIKSLIKKYNVINKKIKFSFYNLSIYLNIYANPQDADFDSSRVLSPIEAIYLAIALSLDGLAVGFGAGLANINLFQVVIFSLVTGMLAILLGCYIGNKVAEKLPLDLSWLSGVILIIIGLSKL